MKTASGAAVAASAGLPYFWVPRAVGARSAGFGRARHLIWIRLAGGFRFTAAFNGDVAARFNPFGLAERVAGGTQWGPSSLLAVTDPWLDDARAELGMRAVTQFSDEIAVIPCVDHEPNSANADGNHQSGLQRFLSGSMDVSSGLFTQLNRAISEGRRVAVQPRGDAVILPPIVMGQPGMAAGIGENAAFQPPLLRGDQLGRFGVDVGSRLPAWASQLSEDLDRARMAGLPRRHAERIEEFMRTRSSAHAYQKIFASDALAIDRDGVEVDGMSHGQLRAIFGDGRSARDLRLALRLFHFGCPAVYLDQGGYDYHSDEENQLPRSMAELCHLISGLEFSLKGLTHPEGGTYWDHTIVALGSEFSRSTGSSRFNSARGSDHGGDFATRWMAMPFMGGPVTAGGRLLGATERSSLAAQGPVRSYRSVFKTMVDALGVPHDSIFPEDEVFDDLFV